MPCAQTAAQKFVDEKFEKRQHFGLSFGYHL